MTARVLPHGVSEEGSPAGNKQIWKNVTGHITHPIAGRGGQFDVRLSRVGAAVGASEMLCAPRIGREGKRGFSHKRWFI